MNSFATVRSVAAWLAQSQATMAIQSHAWVIPTIQSIHIVTIAVALGSVWMVTMRVLGLASRDVSLADVSARFTPWLTASLPVLLATGVLMIIGEPTRELLALSFWIKMFLLLIGISTAAGLRRSLRTHQEGETPGMRAIAIATLMIWLSIVVFGRLIAYDHVWGSWSAALKG